jgi:UDP-glucose 4-epimerase
MNIIVTGSTGFIGGTLVRFFAKKHTLFTPTHRQLDLLDEQAVTQYFKKHAIDIVIHCAVIGGSNPKIWSKEVFGENLRMFFNIATCRRYYKRLINIGSGAEYDKRYPIVNVRENEWGRHIPTDDYGLYKYICASVIKNSTDMVDLRGFGIFGEGEDYRLRFISNALCRRMYELPITIKQNVYFDYLDVRDFVKVVEYFIGHKPKFKAYNVGAGNKIDLVSIAREIRKLYGDNKYPIVIRKTGYANEYSCNVNRVSREFTGFKPTPMIISLKRLSQWYNQHKHGINKKDL